MYCVVGPLTSQWSGPTSILIFYLTNFYLTNFYLTNFYLTNFYLTNFYLIIRVRVGLVCLCGGCAVFLKDFDHLHVREAVHHRDAEERAALFQVGL